MPVWQRHLVVEYGTDPLGTSWLLLTYTQEYRNESLGDETEIDESVREVIECVQEREKEKKDFERKKERERERAMGEYHTQRGRERKREKRRERKKKKERERNV